MGSAILIGASWSQVSKQPSSYFDTILCAVTATKCTENLYTQINTLVWTPFLLHEVSGTFILYNYALHSVQCRRENSQGSSGRAGGGGTITFMNTIIQNDQQPYL